MGLLRRGAFTQIEKIDPALQDDAGEDVVDSTRVALAAASYRSAGHQVLSYEGPFGVGYGVAILYEPTETQAAMDAATGVVSRYEDLPVVARRAVEAKLSDAHSAPAPRAAGILCQRRPVFVTVRSDTGQLRGCRGCLPAREHDLVQETMECAVAAALHDYRFPPVTAAELSRMRFSVSVLNELEPVASPEALDPAVFGVVVTAADGRKGLLLPGIAGIDSAAQQLAVAREKGAIAPDEWVKIQRFQTQYFTEPAAADPAD